MESNAKDAFTYTAISAVVFGIGVFLFAQDMRTAGAPAEHIFLADAITCLLAVVAVVTGVPAVVSRLARG